MTTLLTEGAATTPNAGATSAAAAAVATTENQGPAVGTPNGSTNEAALARWPVPEEYRSQEAVRKFLDDKHTLDPSVLLKSHINLESKLGRDKIPVPQSDDDWKEVWDKLGRPSAPEMYEVKQPAQMPEGMAYDQEKEKFLRSFAHQNGWNQKQFASAYDAFFKMQADQIIGWQHAMTEARNKITADLKREWGADYDRKVNEAKIAMREYGDADFIKMLDETGLGNDPRLVRIFNKVGNELLGEAKLKGAGAENGVPMTREQISERIRSFREQNHKVLFDAENIDHKAKVAELEKLHRLLAAAS
jgi:hypothetical protein